MELVRIIHSSSRMSERLSGTIIETEAYGYTNDRASHAYRGPTSRNMPMFGEVGRAYIYFVYGNHFCLNISAYNETSKAGAVLVRALEPSEGIETMKRSRGNYYGLTSGPSKICQALKINLTLNSLDMTDPRSEVHIELGKERGVKTVAATRRVGIKYATKKKWRFILTD